MTEEIFKGKSTLFLLLMEVSFARTCVCTRFFGEMVTAFLKKRPLAKMSYGAILHFPHFSRKIYKCCIILSLRKRYVQ